MNEKRKRRTWILTPEFREVLNLLAYYQIEKNRIERDIANLMEVARPILPLLEKFKRKKNR